ncbi:hypothetical protein [Mesobacillus foraminis]|uniref:Uncharacterized protein n=1 Tax=Mesobacillus foraminis TaxID=279826 RepID=A0A4R2BD01_9BACI|nr:hypothetical protein [Mesobacillus foraminis]TCN24102.1 hypothetical protein EV146_108212 [Mesobacillus foraminis]
MAFTNRIRFMLLLIFIMAGGTGCMESESKVLGHLEEKYHQKFEVEEVKEGSDLFPEMYGKDQVFAYPEGKPELIFVAGESKKNDGDYYDTYVLSLWGEELTETYEDQVKKEIAGDSISKFYLRAADNQYDASMMDLSVFDYLKNKNQNVDIVLQMAILTDGEPNLDEYKQGLFHLFQLLKEQGTDKYTLSVGFVDKSEEEISDYIRVSNVNNVAWTNLKGKVYGAIVARDYSDIQNADDLVEYYQPNEEQ